MSKARTAGRLTWGWASRSASEGPPQARAEASWSITLQQPYPPGRPQALQTGQGGVLSVCSSAPGM